MVSKILNPSLILFLNKILVIRAGIKKKCLSEYQTVKTQIRLLLKKQFDLGLHCLSRPLWQASSVENFRICTIHVFFYYISGMHL